MSFAFVCAEQDEDARPDKQHTTTGVMVQCTHCGKFAVGGYMCDTCEHDDIDPADQLVGHGVGVCTLSAPVPPGPTVGADRR